MPLRQGLYLNLSSDHLDRYADLAAYGASKMRIYPRAERCLYNAGDAATTPPQDALGRALPVGLQASGAPFGVGEGGLWGPGGWSWPLDRLPLVGTHNLENVLFALTAAWDFGADLAALGPALESFTPLPHRCAVAGWVQGVRYVNDSKATNVGATVAALKGLGDLHKVVLLAGGLAKGADLSPLRAAASGLRHAYLFGTDAPALAAALGDACPVTCVETLDAALSGAAELTSAGDTVILAPACASFDQFRSFEHRGEVFEAAVAERADRLGACA
jgi:UDP-N-acetylmuramoylalanine--D-glutamate ligase